MMCMCDPARTMSRVYMGPYMHIVSPCVSALKYGCPLLFVVGVDSENRRCILGQCLLRSECTETFEWVLDKYHRTSGGRHPNVRSTLRLSVVSTLC